jgi:hypothetical protein
MKMTKKTLYIVLIAIVLLAGLLFLTQPRTQLPFNNSIQTRSTNQDGSVVAKQADKAITLKSSQVEVIKAEHGSAPKNLPQLPTVERGQSDRWRLLKSSPSLESSILGLTNDSDVEAVMFSLHLKLLCNKSVFFTDKDPTLAIYNPTGESYRDFLRKLNKESDKGLTEESISKAIALKDEFARRCGQAINSGFASSETKAAIQKSRDAKGALISSPINSKSFEGEGAAARLSALDIVLRDRDLAPIWLAQRFPIFQDFAERAGYFEGMKYSEQQALGWTVICNIGGDCNDNGITRLDACLTSQLCAGSSVAEAVASAIGADKVGTVAARANKLALDLAASGAGFFKPLPKSTK